jgi:hypothetical protein
VVGLPPKLTVHWRRQGRSISLVFVVVSLLVTISHIPLHAQGPQSGQITVQSIVPAPPPPDPAVIESPQNGQHFDQDLISVSGTCPTTTTVEIYKNDIFAGSTTCSSGNFLLQINLVPGKNKLIAKVKDSLDQYGPDSSPVSVVYDRPSATPPTPVQPPSRPPNQFSSGGRGGQRIPLLLVSTDTIYRGGAVGRPLALRIELIGGSQPYAAQIKWGDDKTDLIPRPQDGDFWVHHQYSLPGTYIVSITASDSVGQTAFIQTVVIINGEPGVPPYLPGLSASLWPPWSLRSPYVLVLSILLLLILCFWLGWRYGARRRKE